MTVIELAFPAGGRLHATPWGRHVNEGATEWPISPWRVQRALVATWYLKARDDIDEAVVRSLMDAMAGTLPGFDLPAAVQSHTRHFMPSKGGNKTKVFDSFVQTPQPLRIAWDLCLDEDQRTALSLLCERLSYLGRAESVVEAKLLPPDASFDPNSMPLPEGEEVPSECELVRVLCPDSPVHHAAWVMANQPIEESRSKGKNAKAKSSSRSLPLSVFEALHAETMSLQAEGWMIPPGSRWVDYTRPVDCFEPSVVRPSRQPKRPVTVARFAIASAVLPRITQTISVAERMHQTLAKRADGRDCARVFIGKETDGEPLKGHQHTHIFCELGEKRDAIGFITLYAPMGFNHEAQRIIEEVQRKPLWGHGGHDLELILLGFGDVHTFDIPIFRKAKRWTSLTPFVSTRHAKHYADGRPKLDGDGWPIGSPAQDLRRLLMEDRGVTPKSVSLPDTKTTLRPELKLRTLQFQTERRHGNGKRGHQSGVGFTLEFDQEIQGPLSFGYGCHFGLGLFVPLEGS
ncbi:MAG: type I-U CRISPR-associated protein Cas5/Cas6 [Verrucomicrobiae bacterium]|nr:type I-U CRISPR-associated protein Cas5/Cas6 [Verrucomicrobiae bacterium]